ncbi:MAG TPA: type II toxin-antitoxin system RelE/ParE family toxin [Gemmatimonadaceae bacterium]|nr:type II toxin-antitoxin system RelE/ParE family toxin [Gemmatimonadaceae bacterium]
MPGKRILWVGTALDDLKDFSENARREAGHALHLVQLGQEPPDWRPMSTIGPGAIEIRVHAESEYRVIYVVRFAEGIYVLHAFVKRSRQTPQRDLELARARLREVAHERRQRSAKRRGGSE